MITRKAPQTYAALRTTGLTALMLFGAYCGSALASTEVQAPCPELNNQNDAALHEILQRDIVTSPSIVRTVDSSDDAVTSPPALAGTASKPAIDKHDPANDLEEVVNTSSESPEITTRLPGVSASDLPRFRRHMFRTDI